jgi:hypothetical protein
MRKGTRKTRRTRETNDQSHQPGSRFVGIPTQGIFLTLLVVAEVGSGAS